MSAWPASTRPTAAHEVRRLPDRAAAEHGPGEGGCWRQALTDPIVWALVAVGLVLRLVVWALLPDRGFVSDETEYYAAARVLADGRGFSYYDAAPWLRPPGYLLLLAASFRLLGPAVAPIQIVQVGLSLALGPLVAWISLLATGRRDIARLAAGFTLLLLPLAVLPWLLLTETLFTVLLLLGIGGLLARWRGGGLGWLALAGAALGGACLTRGIAIGFVGMVVVGLALWGRGDWRRRLGDAVVLAAIVAAVIAPWTLRNWLAYRAVVPLETTAAYNLWLRAQGGRGELWMLSELLEQPDPPARQAHALQRGLALARQDPGGYVARGWRELGDVARLNFGAAERFTAGYASGEVSRPWLALSLALDDLLYLALLPLAALGLLRQGGALRWLTLGWLGWVCLMALTFFAIARFRAPLLPLLAIQAAIGAVELKAAWRRRGGRRVVAVAALLAAALVAIVLPSIDLRAYTDGWRARADWETAQAAESRRLAGDPAGALAALDTSAVTWPPRGADARPLARATRPTERCGGRADPSIARMRARWSRSARAGGSLATWPAPLASGARARSMPLTRSTGAWRDSINLGRASRSATASIWASCVACTSTSATAPCAIGGPMVGVSSGCGWPIPSAAACRRGCALTGRAARRSTWRST